MVFAAILPLVAFGLWLTGPTTVQPDPRAVPPQAVPR